jgi:nicotinamidase/pyrazinamidase
METVFFDIDTQIDFVDPKGALYVPGSREILPNIRRLLEFASEHDITTVSSTDAHVIDDPEFRQYPPHCIAGTPGQRRYFADLPRLPRRIWPADSTAADADLKIEAGKHYIVEKRAFPLFVNPWIRALRDRGVFRAMPAVAFGVAADVCVRANVLDLCGAGAWMRVVRDAIAGITAVDTERALDEMARAGAQFVTTDEIVKN